MGYRCNRFKVHNGKLYLSPIVDLFNGEVISFNLSRHPVFAQVVDMLEKVFIKIPDWYYIQTKDVNINHY